MIDAWVSQPNFPKSFKFRISKVRDSWILVFPGNIQAVRFDTWQQAFQAAMRIQDERNSP